MENYEERYNQALERARKLAIDLPNGRADRLYHVSDLEAIFPELKNNAEMMVSCIRMCLTDANEQKFKEYNTTLKDCLTWLEKQGENKSSWSEEDEKMLDSIIDCIDGLIFIDSDQLNWLKSLKPRWKPSEKQMEALKKRTYGLHTSSETRKTLESLINDLKNL